MSKRSLGFLYAVLAYVSWGLFPLYWKPFSIVLPIEVVAHRIIWSLVVLGILVLVLRQTVEVRAVLRNKQHLLILFITASLLSLNWGMFIYGVATKQVIQTSLGYFLNPLVSILLGTLFLKERLSKLQIAAVLLATFGVIHFAVHIGQMPWIALTIAFSFGIYGLLRKVVHVTPLVGLLVETALMFPIALGMILFLMNNTPDKVGFGSSTYLTLLFLSVGIVTTLPLLAFNSAAKLLPLSTMGFLQFLTPTLQLLTGVLIFKEPFSHREGISFIFIWAAIALYLCTVIGSRTHRELEVPNPD